ncbi:MAG TPA: hypothetical protein VEX66_18140 [Microlunatus sp.]|nr:hypothetical protein [Microlunatus sp.]
MPGRRAELPAALTERPFTAGQALALGSTRDMLRGPAVQRIDRGIFLDARLELTLKWRLAGYLLMLPAETVVDSVTALQLNGVEVGPTEPYRFCTTAEHHPSRPSIVVRRVAELPPNVGKVSRTAPALVAARTQLGLLDLVIAGDWLIRRRVDSPRETRLRLLIVLAELPEPECNVDLGDELFFIGRVDLYLRAWNVAVEYEGDQHRKRAKQFAGSRPLRGPGRGRIPDRAGQQGSDAPAARRCRPDLSRPVGPWLRGRAARLRPRVARRVRVAE